MNKNEITKGIEKTVEIVVPDPKPKTWVCFDTIRGNCVYKHNFIAALEDSIHQDGDFISLSEDEA